MTRLLTIAAPSRRLDLAAKPAPLLTDMEAGGKERVRLYHSERWLRERDAFLAANPLCAPCQEQGLVVPASVVDHIDGHQHPDWLARFWNQARWQACCLDCHAAKSAAELAEWRRAGGAPKTLQLSLAGTARGPSRESRQKLSPQGNSEDDTTP